LTHLLARGEDPKAIRILDIAPPEERFLNKGVSWIKTNITDKLAVTTAFAVPWPDSTTQLPITVYHTAAVIRPQDRLKCFLHLCSKVNVDGTANVLAASKAAGADIFIWTSSGSTAIHRPHFWIFPWTKHPKNSVQVLSDSTPLPKSHTDFFGNYAASKATAETLVRKANDPASNFRTGCIRPTNGIYGTGGVSNTAITEIYLHNAGSPTWAHPILQSFVHAENVSLAHLLYEQNLVNQSADESLLPTGGQSYVVSDPNPAIAFSDLYALLTTLSTTPVSFPALQPAPLLLIAYLVEAYLYLRFWVGGFLPGLPYALEQMQPSLFGILDVHVFADDGRARLAPELGGLGYDAPLTTLDGMCRRLVDWNTKAKTEGVKVKGKMIVIGPVKVDEDGVGVDVVAPKI
jgi:nucleoside-diphosphate-sugar epimerase